MKHRRFLLLVGIILLVLVGTPGWLIYCEVRQQRLNHTLIEAIKKKDTKTALAVLEQGADANTQDVPVDERSTWERLLERLRSGFRPPSPQFPQDVPALLLASYGEKEVVKALVKHGADVNVSSGKTKTTPLMVAVFFLDRDTVEFLLQQGANVDARDFLGGTTLRMTVTMRSGEDIVEKATLLLDHGANINIQDDAGETTLHYAALYGEAKMVKFLLERGAEVNIKSKSGVTPLKAARKAGNVAIVKLLQQAGAKE